MPRTYEITQLIAPFSRLPISRWRVVVDGKQVASGHSREEAEAALLAYLTCDAYVSPGDSPRPSQRLDYRHMAPEEQDALWLEHYEEVCRRCDEAMAVAREEAHRLISEAQAA